MSAKYDLIVIGSGPGGYVAAIRASQLGMKVAIVEKENLGGICLNWGCIPTKALLKSAQVYNYVQHAKDYGVEVSGSNVDFDSMINRSRGVANGMSKGVEFLMKKNKIEKLMGFGKLVDKNKVEVKAEDGTATVYEAENVILATGGRAKQLPHIPIDGEKIIGYRQAMTLPKQPKKMVVMGSGAIGVEFAYFYNSIGTEVTVVEFLPTLVPNEDKDVAKELEKSFKKQGIKSMTNAAVTGVDTSGEGCVVTIKNNKNEKETVIECDVVLSAVGVETNLEGIGLEEVGVAHDRGKVLVNDYYQTNIPSVYAIGDIVHGPALAHVASHEGIICVEKMSGMTPEPMNYNNIPGCTYTYPEIASVGFTEEKAKEAGYDIKVGKFPFSASGKASASGAKEGFVKVIFDAKYGEWLGCHMIGMNVTEMIAEAVAARKLEATAHEIITAVHPHPTLSEAVMEAVAQAYDECIHL
ncbi:dihydrolipoyl dehydrogenase [Sediminitomix flava]|uniref:Dihydrolipoyl dehydrogenase n=1 Tax=Sediminitomix flava TaxID=379075 RepID=A0A315YWI5_SEDFL|nr:dihydrolipoyl dehydrogenase [Sediminitomix flava]PWJ34219.1 dihydrolipoamide dehydrogenase [Sediminitomix flava]